MAKTQRATNTVLAFGKVKTAVSLYKTTGAETEAAEWDTAGPNGGKLRYVDRAAEKQDPTADVQTVEDPLAGDSGPIESEAREVASRASERAERATQIAETAAKVERPEGELRRILVEEGDETETEVTREAIRRGVRRDGKFIDLTTQLDAIAEQSKLEEARIVSFIDVGQVDRARILGSYDIGANEPGAASVLHTLYIGLRNSRRVGVVKFTKRSVQSLGIVTAHPRRKTLVLIEVEWANRVRVPHEKAAAVTNAEVDPDAVKGVEALIELMEGPRVELDKLRDDRETQTAALLEAVEAGKVETFKAPEPPKPEPRKTMAELLAESIAAADAA